MPDTYRTKADAEAAWSVLAAQMVTGRWVNPDRARSSLQVYAETWVRERPHLAGTSRELYAMLLRLHIVPFLGTVQMRHLTPEHVRTWRQARVDAGVGASTVAKAYRLLSAVCVTAVDDELINRNPCRIKGAGVESAAERPVLEVAEVFALADAIAPRWRLLVLLACFGSLRWGELIGLERSDIDLRTMTVHVRRSVAEVGGQLVVKAPKSEAGVRHVSLPKFLRAEIRAHLKKYVAECPTSRVFLGAKGATPRRAHFVKPWRAAKAAAGVSDQVHLHDLRHTGNHFAASSGASTKELMARMGHSSMRAALIYQHATAKRDRAIADAMDRLHEESRAKRAKGTKGGKPGEASK